MHRWVASFLEQLELGPRTAGTALRPSARGRALRGRGADPARRATDELLLLLDYDGTLVPFTRTPELARPDAALLALLRALARRRDTEVHVVSGRRRDTLEQWLGRPPDLAPRRARLLVPHAGRASGPARTSIERLAGSSPVLSSRDFAARTPGSLVEVKTAALAWHYRMADPETGARRPTSSGCT